MQHFPQSIHNFLSQFCLLNVVILLDTAGFVFTLQMVSMMSCLSSSFKTDNFLSSKLPALIRTATYQCAFLHIGKIINSFENKS